MLPTMLILFSEEPLVVICERRAHELAPFEFYSFSQLVIPGGSLLITPFQCSKRPKGDSGVKVVRRDLMIAPGIHAQWTVFDAGGASISSAICRITSRIRTPTAVSDS